MTTPTRLAPVRREVRRPPALPRAPEPPRPARVSRRQPVSYGRVLRWSLGVSVLLHVLLLTLWPPFDREAGLRRGAAPADPAPESSRLEMRAIVPVPSNDVSADAPLLTVPPTQAAAAERLARPETDRDDGVPRALDVRPGGAPGGVSGESESEVEAGARESFRPGFSDGRLYVDPREIRSERAPDRHAQYMEHLQARIDALNDSTYGRGPDTDWTHTDSEGRRWGISPEGLHLGGLTIPKPLLPLPRSTGRNVEQEAERERARQRGEIIRQEEDRAREEARERSRKAAEERRKRGGGGGSG